MSRNKFFPQESTGRRLAEEVVAVDGRNFLISYWQETEMFHGHVRPEPAHSGEVEHPEFGTFQSETKLNYRISRTDEPHQYGRFQQIETVPAEQRKGWATAMVRALLAFFPATYWNNENLNEQSGPLFMKLQAEFPERIAAISDNGDGTYRVAPNPIPGG